MMKHTLFLSAGLLILAACNGAGDEGSESADTLRADCLTIANDEEGQEEIADIGTDAEGFCDCAESMIAAMPPEDQEKAKATMNKVATGMTETGESTEDVVGKMMGDAMSRPEDTDAQATSEGIRLVGQMIDDIGDGFEDTGSCPAA